jgi:plastocyanin
MRVRALVVAAAMLSMTIGGLASAGAGEADPSADRPVSIVDFSFMPQRLAVRVGDSVTWTNNGEAPHTTTSATWDSGTLEPGETFTRTFNAPGRFVYRCNIHRTMRGIIRVRP